MKKKINMRQGAGIEDDVIVVCVLENVWHSPEARLSVCNFCGRNVWVQEWNMHNKKTCLDCLKKIPDKEFGMKRKDFMRVKEIIEGMEK